MQLVILGMHRSGTSMLSRLVNLMGVYFGLESDSIGANEENPHGFWERQDVRDMNDYLLHSAGNDWDKLSGFNLESLEASQIDYFQQCATELNRELDQSAPWFIKEPRICVLLGAWQKVLDSPVYIHIYRNPIEVASSLFQRNKISIPEGIALWEKYNIDALNGARNCKRVLISHARLLHDPVNEVISLFDQLRDFGVEGLKKPSEEEIASFIDKSLYRQRYGQADLESYLNVQQKKLFSKLEDGTIFDHEDLLSLSEGASLALDNYQLRCDQLESAKREIEAAMDEISAAKREIAAAQREILSLEKHREEIVELAGRFSEHFVATFESRRWKVGDKLVSLANRLKGDRENKATVIRWVEESNLNLSKHKEKINEKTFK